MIRLPYIATGLVFSLIVCAITLANNGSQNVISQWIASQPYGDKWAHFLLFGCFALCLSYALKLATFSVFNMRIYWGCALVIVFALTEEGSQYFLPTRTLDFWDATADIGGVLSAAALSKIQQHFF